MKNWLNFVFVSSEVEAFKLNTDILETNLINIIILICSLVYVLGSFLQESLTLRQEEILTSLQESEKRLNEANQRVQEAEALMRQVQILIEEAQKQTQTTKINLLNSNFVQARKSMEQQFSNSLLSINLSDQLALQNLLRQMSELAFKEVSDLLEENLGYEEHAYLIDTRLNCLGGRK